MTLLTTTVACLVPTPHTHPIQVDDKGGPCMCEGSPFDVGTKLSCGRVVTFADITPTKTSIDAARVAAAPDVKGG